MSYCINREEHGPICDCGRAPFCGASRDGRICIRPADALDDQGLPHQQHRANDGKRWYYSDGEKEADEHVPFIELVEKEMSANLAN